MLEDRYGQAYDAELCHGWQRSARTAGRRTGATEGPKISEERADPGAGWIPGRRPGRIAATRARSGDIRARSLYNFAVARCLDVIEAAPLDPWTDSSRCRAGRRIRCHNPSPSGSGSKSGRLPSLSGGCPFCRRGLLRQACHGGRHRRSAGSGRAGKESRLSQKSFGPASLRNRDGDHPVSRSSRANRIFRATLDRAGISDPLVIPPVLRRTSPLLWRWR